MTSSWVTRHTRRTYLLLNTRLERVDRLSTTCLNHEFQCWRFPRPEGSQSGEVLQPVSHGKNKSLFETLTWRVELKIFLVFGMWEMMHLVLDGGKNQHVTSGRHTWNFSAVHYTLAFFFFLQGVFTSAVRWAPVMECCKTESLPVYSHAEIHCYNESISYFCAMRV